MVDWDATARLNNALHATGMSLIFQGGEICEASATEKPPAPVDLSALPISEQQFTFHAGLPRLSTYGANLPRSESASASASGARYAQHDRDTSDLYSDAIFTPAVYLQKNVRLLSQFESRDACVNFPVVRIRRSASVGFQFDPAFPSPCLSTCTSEWRHHVLPDAQYEHHRVRVAGPFAAVSIHHPEFVFDKLSALAGRLLTFQRRYSLGAFPVYDHEDAAAGFFKLGAMIRDLIEVMLSKKYLSIPLVMNVKRGTRFNAVLDRAIMDGQTFKISLPANIDDIVRLALSGVKLTQSA